VKRDAYLGCPQWNRDKDGDSRRKDNTMKFSKALVLGTVASSLAMALPAQASHGYDAGAMVTVKRDYGDYRRDSQEERRQSDGRQSLRRNGGDSKSYGYGYERRQRSTESGNNTDDERRKNRREERRDERRSNGGWR
jgi:hypothetical protein